MTFVLPRLVRIRSYFDRIRSDQESFVLSLPTMLRKPRNRAVAMSKSQQERLSEMAFVIMFTAWERFLEDAFESLVVDAPATAFRKRQRVMVADVETAHDLIRGDRPFAEWADPSRVKERAKKFFRDGEPFESALSAIHDELNKIRIIRNRCIHLSQHSDRRYQKMVRQVFGSGKRIPPGRLLLDSPPSSLSSAVNAQNYGTVFQLYGAILATAASQIVPEKLR